MDDAPTALDARLNEPSTEGGVEMDEARNASASSGRSSPTATSSDGISTTTRPSLAAAGRPAAEEFVEQMTFANRNCRDNNCLDPGCRNEECIRTGDTSQGGMLISNKWRCNNQNCGGEEEEIEEKEGDVC